MQMKGVGVMAKAPCRDCTKRHLGCHDKCDDYQATKPKYNQIVDEAKLYLSDKRHKFKKDYGRRDYYR